MLKRSKTIKNCIIVGEGGSGKSVLCSILTNPKREDGYYFMDPEIEGANIRVNEQFGTSFVDTLPLSSEQEDNLSYLQGVQRELQVRHLAVTGLIFCIRYGRVKINSIQTLKAILGLYPSVHIVITGCSGNPSFMIDYFHSRIDANISFSWYQARVGEDIDEFGGRWISLSEAGEAMRANILGEFGLR